MGDYWTNATRHPEDVGNGNIRRTIKFDTRQPSSLGVPIGTLERGARPLGCFVTIITAFNAGTSNALVVGTAADDDGFATAAGTVSGTIGYKPSLVGAQSGIPFDADTTVYAKFTQTGTAATTGVAIVSLHFENRREIEGIPFPANP